MARPSLGLVAKAISAAMRASRRRSSSLTQGHSILIAWNSAIIENTQDNISKSSVFIDADVLGCINMRHQTTFNALYSAPDEPCGCRNSHMHINEIFVSNDPAGVGHARQHLYERVIHRGQPLHGCISVGHRDV